MAITVKDKRTNKKYILIGTGLGMYKATRPSFLGGNLLPHEEEGKVTQVAVCDHKGDIIWISSDDIQVLEIDGVNLSDISMYEADIETEQVCYSKYNCPVCGRETNINERYCYGCGFNLFENK